MPTTDPIPVSISFDVDADESWRFRGPNSTEMRDLTTYSWGHYGIKRGLPRVRQLLDELDLRATFFVPGAVADAHPEVIANLAEDRHEIAHHGYHHFFPAEIPVEVQADEFNRGKDALRRVTGADPLGYRAPSWQMTADTWLLLCDGGIVYDSSLMGDDRPYLVQIAGRELVEMPVHWWLDDVPHFIAVSGSMGALNDPRRVFEIWNIELECAIREQRATGFAFHPEVIGRGWLFGPFADWLRALHADPRVRLTNCLDVATLLHSVS